MSRKECKHGSRCGHELCPLEDEGCLGIECQEYEDSGYRQKHYTFGEATEKLFAAQNELSEVLHMKITWENGKEITKRIKGKKKKVANWKRISDQHGWR